MNENELSEVIVDAAIEVPRELGGLGFLEMEEDLRLRGTSVKRYVRHGIYRVVNGL